MTDSVRAVLNRLHRWLAGWRVAIHVVLKLRNQCDAVIAYRMAPSPEPAENGELWLVRTLARGARVFADVGAHHGRWTSLLLEYAANDARGLLFEPNADYVPALQSRFAGQARLEVCGFALGAEAGESRFRPNGERSRVVAGIEVAGDRRVRVSTLDREIGARGWERVDIVKIDAEGYDLAVLRGAAALLAQQRIDVVQFEYGDGWPAASATLMAALELLAGHGYATYLLRPDGLELPQYGRWGEHFSYSNYVAVSPQLRAQAERWLRP